MNEYDEQFHSLISNTLEQLKGMTIQKIQQFLSILKTRIEENSILLDSSKKVQIKGKDGIWREETVV